MTECCTQTADVVSRQHLRSTSQRKMIVPQDRMDSYGRRCFAVAGPSTWNSLPDSDISVSKINLVSVTVLCVTGSFPFLLFFSFSFSFYFRLLY